MAEFLLELQSEDIPARMQARAAEDLKRLVTEKLDKAGLLFTSAAAHSTPRRLALVVDGLPERQPDVREEKRGPRIGAPDQAVQGFLRGAGVASLDQCEQRDTGKGVFWFAIVEKAGESTASLLPGIIAEAVRELPWPKSMRWANSTARWVRPLSGVLALFDGRPVAGELAVGNGMAVPFGTTTYGHRFLAPERFTVTGFADYRERLERAFVLLDREQRRARIAEQAERLAADVGLRVAPDEGLLDEVAGLVEWPVPLLGSIDDAFMTLPPEVRQTSMRVNQRYFTLTTRDGKPAPRFVVIANMITEDGGAAVVSGNERVLRARLSDAKFFWDQDLKIRLEDRLPKLSAITFHAKLGTVAEKMSRVERLAREIQPLVGTASGDLVGRAAALAKADLVSGMVGEFPELQGVMGRYYALAQGEDAAVADAIAEHYKPLGPNDRCPTAPFSIMVALADKIDSLVGFFAIDEKPTGSKDPYALRRAALGVIRLIVENGLRFPLVTAFRSAAAGLGDRSSDLDEADLLAFFADRLKVTLRERGIRHDLVDAIFALGGEDDLVRLLARVEALRSFLATESGSNLLVAYRRAANIVRIEERKDGASYPGPADPAVLEAEEERVLSTALAAAEEAIATALKTEDFVAAMQAMAALRGPVDLFFDKVTVNAQQPDLRANRLRLLSQIKSTMDRVAEFSRIEG